MNEHLWTHTDEEWQEHLSKFSSADFGWAAGFFDGEGCITVGRTKKPLNRDAWFSVRFLLTNTHRGALERFQDMFRGTISARKQIPGRQQIYQLRLDGKLCERCLEALLPHSTVKRVQIDAALTMRKLLTSNDPRKGVPQSVYDELGRLHSVVIAANGRSYRQPSHVSDGYVAIEV